MQQSFTSSAPALVPPSFYLTGRQSLRPEALVLATVTAVLALASVLFALSHAGRAQLNFGSSGMGRSTTPTSAGSQAGDKDDDPDQVDTIVLGDPADAPVPARRGDHVSAVHPTLLIHLPRFGDQTGLIPDTPAGRLLYGWLAAFNQASLPALGNALPSAALSSAARAQMVLRQQTGGFNLLSAREVQPGLLVFRLRDQTPLAMEALGTLQLRPDTKPASVASFSLRAVPAAHPAPAPR